ncbi:MAG: PAS domain S-box protein [Mariprofundales bacterium]
MNIMNLMTVSGIEIILFIAIFVFIVFLLGYNYAIKSIIQEGSNELSQEQCVPLQISSPTWLLAKNGEVLAANELACSLIGDSCLHVNIHNILHGSWDINDCPYCVVLRSKSIDSNQNYNSTLDCRLEYDLRCWSMCLWLFNDNSGRILCVLNEEKQAIKLDDIETDELRNKVLEASHTGVWIWHIKTQKFYFDANTAQLLSLPIPQLGLGNLDLRQILAELQSDDCDILHKCLQQSGIDASMFCTKTRFSKNSAANAHNGNIIPWLEWEGAGISDETRITDVLGTIRDVSKQVSIMHSISENEARYAALIERSHDGIAIIQEGSIKFANLRLQKMCACSAASMLGREFNQFVQAHINDDDVHKHMKMLNMPEADLDNDAKVYAKNETGLMFEAILKPRQGGQVLHVEISASQVEYMGGEALLYIVRDISERLAAEAQLRKLSLALQQMDESVLISDKKGIIEYVNPAFTRITGYEREEVLGKTPGMLRSGEQDLRFYHNFWTTISSGKTWRGSLIDKRKDGTLYPVIMSVSPIFDERDNITHYVAVQQDISERERLEEQFRQAQKMEALGSLVGGIAHDFNNMLAGITGNIYLAGMMLGNKHEDARDKLHAAEELGQRAADMVKQLLSFARGSKTEMSNILLRKFLQRSLRLVRVSVPKHVNVQGYFCDDLLAIRGDETQLQQILLNLLTNARDAVEEREHPKIELHVEPYEATISFHQKYPQLNAMHYAHIQLRDNGHGIEKKHLKSLFEPFFSTKEQGKGTGLGLAMVYSTVQAHHGMIEVESHLGEGTVFHIYLPLLSGDDRIITDNSDDLSTDNSNNKVKKEVQHGKQELILLVDDDEHVRRTHATILRALEYRVLEAYDANSALHMFKEYKDECSLAMLDVIMPGVTGDQLAETLRDISPKLPVLFVTGFDKDSLLDHKDDDLTRMLTKPVRIRELGKVLKTMIINAEKNA